MKNDTHLNILISYAYLFGNERFMGAVQDYVNKKEINLMIDSGAFTKFNSKEEKSHINVEDYTEWLKEYGWMAEKYVMLDVIGDSRISRSNYEYMLKKGTNPMYVATAFDVDFDYIRQAVSCNPNICVAGGATNKNQWMIKRFQEVYRETEQKAKIHGLGYFTFPNMLRLNLASVDTSSWKTAPARFGQFIFFSKKELRTYRIDHRTAMNKLTPEMLNSFSRYGVTPKMFWDKENRNKDTNIQGFMSIVNNLEIQKYCKRHGLDFFFACGCENDLRKIIEVDKDKNITYNKYKEICRNL